MPRQQAPARTDPLAHPDPHTAAQAATVENLLRCWLRETDAPTPEHGVLRVPLPASGTALLVPVRYWSPTGWHRLGAPWLADAPRPGRPVDAVTLAALLAREAPGATETAAVDLVARVADSVRRTAVFIGDRR
ncbi:iron transporter, partial [Streptomyces sp. TRM76130]|nr:iron transporter [Streptomyces sp. TRM76130]